VNHSATPAPIPVGDLMPLLLLAAVLLLVVYLVQFDQGALSRMGSLMHELMHDGRHVLGVPCH
jgi:Probable cobalt transporter subunit (CbtB)